MVASYDIIAEPDRELLRIILSGFFDLADLSGFNAERLAGYTRLGCPPNEHLTLVDIRNFKIQSQAVFEAFRIMVADPKTRARRIAFVTGQAAIRMQVRRLGPRDNMQCFADTASAEAWLMSPATGYALAG